MLYRLEEYDKLFLRRQMSLRFPISWTSFIMGKKIDNLFVDSTYVRIVDKGCICVSTVLHCCF